MAEKLIASVGGRIIRGRRIIDCARWTPGKLIGGVPVELLAALSHPQAEDVTIGIGHGRTEAGVRHGILAVNIAPADVETVFQIARRAKLVKETGAPIERQWLNRSRTRFQIDCVQAVPISPVNIHFKIPIRRRAIRHATDDIFGEMKRSRCWQGSLQTEWCRNSRVRVTTVIQGSRTSIGSAK